MTHTLYHGDCLIEMDRIEDGSIDCILADLPYGTTACKWDVVIPFEPLWKQYKRVIKKRGAVVLFASDPFTVLLIMSNFDWYKYKWVWNKQKAGNFAIAKNQPLRVIEDILVFCGGATVYNPQMVLSIPENRRPRNKSADKKTDFLSGFKANTFRVSEYHNENYRYPINLLSFKSTEAECNNANRLHPTQKPVALLSYLILTYTNEGDTILDNCAGSGSTLEAAMRCNRHSIGIEKDAGYFNVAQQRLARVATELRGDLDHLPMFAGPVLSEVEGAMAV